MMPDNNETKYVLECNLKEFRDYIVQTKGKLFAKNHFYIFKDKSYKLMETEILNINADNVKMYFRYFLKDLTDGVITISIYSISVNSGLNIVS